MKTWGLCGVLVVAFATWVVCQRTDAAEEAAAESVTYEESREMHSDLRASFPPGDVSNLAFRLIEARHNSQLRALLSQGMPANLSAADGTTLLMYAALHGDVEGINILLRAGADPNRRSNRGESALIWAASDIEKVRTLVQAGADVNAETESGRTALRVAAGSTAGAKSVAFLLEAGAKYTVASPNDSPLSIAAKMGAGDTVKCLLEHHAKSDFADPGMIYAFINAISRGHAGIARDVMQWDGPGKLDLTSDVLAFALTESLMYPNHEITLELLERGAVTKDIRPVVFSDIADDEILRMMIERGAAVDSEADRDGTALDRARLRGHHGMAEVLSAAGVKSTRNLNRHPIPHNNVTLTEENQRQLISESVEKSLGLLLESSDWLLESKMECNSCHHQDLPVMAASIAMSRGIRVSREALERINVAQTEQWNASLEELYTNKPSPNMSQIGGYLLWGRSALGLPADSTSKAMVWYFAGTQLDSGAWHSHAPRMPIQDGPHQCTALVIQALRMYPLVGREAEMKVRVQRAVRWLEDTPAQTHTNRAFRLLGLAWGGANPAAIESAMNDMWQSQNENGGWSQLVNLNSDAWATGLAMLALHTAGVPPSHSDYRRAVQFLLDTQFADGSWYVQSRTQPFLPHFDSHFPYGRDQWISAAGTAVASAALALALDPIDEFQGFVPTGQVGVSTKTALAAAANDFRFDGQRTIDFHRDIRPMLEASCLDCHQGNEPAGSFRIEDRASFMQGGQSQAVPVLAGLAEKSPLIRHVTDQILDMEMPPLNERHAYPELTDEQVQTLMKWINEGAIWPEDVVLGE